MYMRELILLVGLEAAVAFLLVIIILALIISELLKKTVVTVTVVSVEIDAAQYDHGDSVGILGQVSVDSTPQAGESVNLKVTDSKGVEYALPTTTTTEDGKFTAAWVIPPEVAPGACIVTATGATSGATGTASFTFSNKKTRNQHERM